MRGGMSGQSKIRACGAISWMIRAIIVPWVLLRSAVPGTGPPA